MKKTEIKELILENKIKRPILREGEVYSNHSSIYLYLYNSSKHDMNLGRLCSSLLEGVEYYADLGLAEGKYYISSKQQKNPESQKWAIELDL